MTEEVWEKKVLKVQLAMMEQEVFLVHLAHLVLQAQRVKRVSLVQEV